jgi:hypothetical protein
VRGLVDNLRRHLGPRHEYLADERTETLSLQPGIAEVRIAGALTLHVDGTDAHQATAKLQIYSTGTDENQARALGKRTVLKTAASGDILSLDLDYPPEERQRTILTLALPRTMRLRVTRASSIEARGIAGLEFDNTRGEATLSGITGPIRGTHTGGELTFENVAAIDMTARRSDITIKKASGGVRFDLTGGALNARDLAGDVSLDANRATMEHGGFVLDATVEDGEIRVPQGAPQPSTAAQISRARGPINGGGPTLTLRTSHGDIVIR